MSAGTLRPGNVVARVGSTESSRVRHPGPQLDAPD